MVLNLVWILYFQQYLFQVILDHVLFNLSETHATLFSYSLLSSVSIMSCHKQITVQAQQQRDLFLSLSCWSFSLEREANLGKKRMCSAHFVKPVIAEIQHQISGDQHKIQSVEENDVGNISGDYFGDDSTHVSDQDKYQKNGAFPFGCARFPGFHNRQRPGNSETDQHQGLKKLRHTFPPEPYEV